MCCIDKFLNDFVGAIHELPLRAVPLLLIILAACTSPKPPAVPPAADVAPYTPFAVSKWEMLPDWQTIDLQPTWAAFWQSCNALKNKPGWQPVCVRANELTQPDNLSLRAFFEEGFTPYQVFNPDGSSLGLITGYYEPRLYGSRVKTARFRYGSFGHWDGTERTAEASGALVPLPAVVSVESE